MNGRVRRSFQAGSQHSRSLWGVCVCSAQNTPPDPPRVIFSFTCTCQSTKMKAKTKWFSLIYIFTEEVTPCWLFSVFQFQQEKLCHHQTVVPTVPSTSSQSLTLLSRSPVQFCTTGQIDFEPLVPPQPPHTSPVDQTDETPAFQMNKDLKFKAKHF